MNWTKEHIEQLQQAGKIRGYSFAKTDKNYSSKSRKNIPDKKSKGLQWLEWNLMYWCNEHSLSLCKEYRFCPERGWRFDFAVPAVKVAVEFEGGIFLPKSGHNTARHYTKDTEKYNRATILGWRVIRVTALNYTTAITQLNELVKNK